MTMTLPASNETMARSLPVPPLSENCPVVEELIEVFRDAFALGDELDDGAIGVGVEVRLVAQLSNRHAAAAGAQGEANGLELRAASPSWAV